MLLVYTDGSAYCFGCHIKKTHLEFHLQQKKKDMKFIEGEYRDLTKLSSQTLRKFNYQINKDVHIANYYDKENNLVAQHTRSSNKDFKWKGNLDNIQLFGQHLWRDGGKLCVVTEGEIDCLTVSQYVFQNKFPSS